MRTKKVNRYYCDHCNKGGQSASHMTRHERHCTLNPNRGCRMCVFANGGTPWPMEELLALLPTPEQADSLIDQRLHPSDPSVGEKALAAIREKTDGCPACILAALRQKGISGYFDFDYKIEAAAIFAEYAHEHSPY